jgi:hypothetical protein
MAIEAAGRTIVLPNDRSAHLGRIIGELRSNPDRFRIVLAEQADGANALERFVSLLELIWRGHHRHGDETKVRRHSLEEARMAVLLAVVAVQVLSDGCLTRSTEA